MKVWTVVNQKGGVGKTTSAVSMAGCLSAMGYKVLLADLDPHASLTHYLGYDAANLDLSLYDVFVASHHEASFADVINKTILNTHLHEVNLLPAHMALATLDRTLGEQIGKGLILKKIAARLAPKYDFMLVDCPPVLGVLMVNALVAADHLILPTQTEHLALQGLDKMIATIVLMKKSLSDSLQWTVVPTLFDRRVRACLTAFADMRERYQDNIWKGYIPVDTKFRDASASGQAITSLAPKSRGSFAYEKLVNELLRHA